ncbi:uncharacterized protein L969DRAFT_89440 [Mixia osmundae IAM 14324]|uniref:AB hydrolase-1 domain-containing protein n=1 Tax=Mixia osmundae (strain CBS 9802 / IAM 14324 / JCM 22182 / KY 12970) TaxID=764103 RepID=G7DS97_MIXOS|nr:uncharacterized protein L969DRAFT_89440 [Mixia osmundae IAM 14324]KEI37491.1 hypothetical protein L969DRAFT_89440 [Mixia osmundae IAM 14324]GAA93457.1 hypothetical protein E5Q_00098 [Mixia osmundae IAM 14324]
MHRANSAASATRMQPGRQARDGAKDEQIYLVSSCTRLPWWRRLLCRLGYADAWQFQTSSATLLRLLGRCPHLLGSLASYIPPLIFRSGHIHTIYCTVGHFDNIDVIQYERHVIQMQADGGSLALDFTPPFDEAPLDDRPILIIQHGLTGGSSEAYVRNVLALACKSRAAGGYGYRACVANFRGCANSKMTTGELYHAGRTNDVRTAVRYVRDLLPDAPILLAGFSLGANLVSRYLGEVGTSTPVRAAVLFGCPFDLYRLHLALESTFLGMLYSRRMGASMSNVVERNRDAFEKDPRGVDLEALFDKKGSLTLYQFDSIVQVVLNGFGTTENYYKSQSASANLSGIRVPVLALNALNDPIVSGTCLPTTKNPYVVLGQTQHGGHLGWFSSFTRRWIDKPALEFLEAILSAPDVASSIRKELGEDEAETLAPQFDTAYKVTSKGVKLSAMDAVTGIEQGL